MSRHLRSSYLWWGLFVFLLVSMGQNYRMGRILHRIVDDDPNHFTLRQMEHQRIIAHRGRVGKRKNPDQQDFQAGNNPYLRDFDPTHANASIVVQLSGEMGNNLNKLAFARGLQITAREEFGIHVNLVLRHQDHPKWISAKKNLQRCFPNMRGLDFSAGNTPEYREQQLRQRLTLGGRAIGLEITDNDESQSRATLDKLYNVVSMNETLPSDPVRSIHVPYVLADAMVPLWMMDRFHKDFGEFFAFDDETCCSQVPGSDEIVLHVRNFLTELKGATRELGFVELDPQQTANQLLGGLPIGSSLAIVTRFDNEVTHAYESALQKRGFQTRLISGQKPTEDFCFLKNAQTLAGGERSSFFLWAAYLGNGQAYSYSISNQTSSALYDWKDTGLNGRFHSRMFTTII